MLYDRENGEKDQIACQWSCKNQRKRIKAYKRHSCTVVHYSMNGGCVLILIFNRTNVCLSLISTLILIISATTLMNEVSLIFS
jgi:hypothetical protein